MHMIKFATQYFKIGPLTFVFKQNIKKCPKCYGNGVWVLGATAVQLKHAKVSENDVTN